MAAVCASFGRVCMSLVFFGFFFGVPLRWFTSHVLVPVFVCCLFVCLFVCLFILLRRDRCTVPTLHSIMSGGNFLRAFKEFGVKSVLCRVSVSVSLCTCVSVSLCLCVSVSMCLCLCPFAPLLLSVTHTFSLVVCPCCSLPLARPLFSTAQGNVLEAVPATHVEVWDAHGHGPAREQVL